jgi:hypothetical protein
MGVDMQVHDGAESLLIGPRYRKPVTPAAERVGPAFARRDAFVLPEPTILARTLCPAFHRSTPMTSSSSMMIASLPFSIFTVVPAYLPAYMLK